VTAPGSFLNLPFSRASEGPTIAVAGTPHWGLRLFDRAPANLLKCASWSPLASEPGRTHRVERAGEGRILVSRDVKRCHANLRASSCKPRVRASCLFRKRLSVGMPIESLVMVWDLYSPSDWRIESVIYRYESARCQATLLALRSLRRADMRMRLEAVGLRVPFQPRALHF
jgi:hypothetical protein